MLVPVLRDLGERSLAPSYRVRARGARGCTLLQRSAFPVIYDQNLSIGEAGNTAAAGGV